MKNITTFLYKSTIKPELSLVYVHELAGVKYAVATDAFRLAEYKLPDYLQENMSCGYYQAKAYTEICKAYNKKKRDLTTIANTIAGQTVLQSQYQDYTYPDYKQIIPNENKLTAFTGDLKVNKEYFIDFLNLMETGFNSISFADIKQKDSQMLVYKNNELTILLMASHK